MPTSTTMPGPMSQSDGKLLRKLPGAYWSQRLLMGWSSKGEIVRVTMPSMTPSLGFFFHLRARAVAVGARRRRGLDSKSRSKHDSYGRRLFESKASKELTQRVTKSPNAAGRQVSGRRVALRKLVAPYSLRQKQAAASVTPLFQRRLRLLWLLLDGWGKPAHEAALNLPSGGVRRCFDSGKSG